jgi:predicted ribosome quality control (RQC) complex YloA/Tae2 family protein
MLQTQLSEIEKKIEDLEKADKSLQEQLTLLLEEVSQITKAASMNTTASPTSNKLIYLTEVNEQMFQQIVRLRQLIEYCMEARSVPTHAQYLQALKGDS